MTYGLFVTLAAASNGLFAALYHWVQLRKLPTRTQPEYDETVASCALGYKVIIAAGLALPFLAYAAFRLIDPALFEAELF